MLGTKIGFDLGTTSILAIVDGKGIKINEPSVIAYDTFTEKVKAIGLDAYNMLGRSPDSVTVIRPIREGIIFDYDALQQMMCYYIQRLCGNQIFKPSVIVCVPSGVTDIEKRTMLDLVTSAGAARACVIEEPLAAAFGAGISPNELSGTLVVDIGGGTTDIAVVSHGYIVDSLSTTVAGNSFDEDLCRFARRERDTIIGTNTAESMKKQVGATKFLDAELAVAAVGKDYVTGLPRNIEITSTDVFLCIRENLNAIVESIKAILERTSPELNADILTNGIMLTGGGALLRGIDEYIEERTNIRTRCADDPLFCVVNGIGTMLNNMKMLEENGYAFKSFGDIKEFEEN